MSDERAALLRQLLTIKRRVRIMTMELNDAIDGLPTPNDLLDLTQSADLAQMSNTLAHFHRVESALEEAKSCTEKLRQQVDAVADGDDVLLNPSALRCR